MESLLSLLKTTDFQAIVEADEIYHMDAFIKENASNYSFVGNPLYSELTSTIINNRVRL